MPRPFMIILLNTDHKTLLCLHSSVSLYDHTESYLIFMVPFKFFFGGVGLHLTKQPSALGGEPAGGWECSGKLVQCHLWRPGL